MKRTHKFSLGSRLSVKSPKLIPTSPKPELPAIPQSLSPNPLNSPKNTNEPITTPRLNRPFKSQIQFNYPKQEEAKFKLPESKASLLIEKIPDINPKGAEKVSDEITKLQKEADLLKKSYDEKVVFIQINLIKQLEKKLFNIQFKERVFNLKENTKEVEDNPCEHEKDSFSAETYIEEIKSLKGIIAEQTKAYSKLEEIYYSDTNSLKRDNEKLKMTFKKQDSENLTLKSRLETLSKNLEESEKKSLAKLEEYENKLNSAVATLKDKNSELFTISEILRKAQNEKRNKDDVFKELHRQIRILTESNKILENDLNCQKRELKIVSDSLALEKEKIKLFESQSTEYISMKEKFENLEETLKSCQKSSEFTTQNYNMLKEKYNELKEKFKEKQELLKETQDKLSETNNTTISVGNNPQRLRRTLTLSTISSTGDMQQKENFARLYSKITSLEEELQSERIEKEKFKKNCEYSKKLIDEKSDIILQIEKRVENDIQEQVNLAKDSLGIKIKELGGRCHWYLRLQSEKLRCEKCKIENIVRFKGLNCPHLLCKTCAMFMDSCPSCSSGKLIKLNVLKSVSYNTSRINDLISELLLLINH